MKSPADQKIIQIDITNACTHTCSNCTRFCGHHKKTYFMEPDFFSNAVESLREYSGMVGVMGGEPTIHPKFGDIIKRFEDLRPLSNPTVNLGKPIADFGDHRTRRLADVKCKRGLWSSLGKGYVKHYEAIQRIFPYQCINDHANDGLHQALMITRKELGIPDSEWEKARDKCWVQNLWSSSITPKGAFYCEVAGALDMLLGGPGGWPIEPEWWKRKPEEFGDQIHWCELCSACLAVPRRKANDDVDDASPEWVERLKKLNSPKLQRKFVTTFDPTGYSADEYKKNTGNAEWYLPREGDNSTRVDVDTSKSLYEKKVTAITTCVGYDDYLALTLPHNVGHFNQFIVVTTPDDEKTKAVARLNGATIVESTRIHEDGAPFNKGKAINDGLKAAENDWIQILDSDVILPKHYRERLDGLVLNPGFLYFTKRWGPVDRHFVEFIKDLNKGNSWHSLYHTHANKKRARKTDRWGNDVEHFPYGYFQLFNKNAEILKGVAPAYYDERFQTAENADAHFGMYLYEGISESLPLPDFDVIHLPHGQFRQNWRGRVSPRLTVAPSPAPVCENAAGVVHPSSDKSVAVVVCHHKLPMKRLWEFFVWNADLFEKYGVRVYLSSDVEKTVPDGGRCIVNNQMEVYSPSRASNIGIRAACDDGMEIVVKTDVDCYFTEDLLNQIVDLPVGHGLAPYYMFCLSPSEEDTKKSKTWGAGIGTLALHADVWRSTHGYDERMEGYGREDGEGYERATQCASILREEHKLYHIDHPIRQNDDDNWYPMRSRANTKLVRELGTWRNKDWGKI